MLNSLPPYTQLGVPKAGTCTADGGSPAESLSRGAAVDDPHEQLPLVSGKHLAHRSL